MQELQSDTAAHRRVKIYTVHGTFANEATWDDWHDNVDPKADSAPFVNRLANFLGDNDVDFDKVDHVQFNWSGGNSHDERRIAAVRLKRAIESDLSHQFDGANDVASAIRSHYSGGVFVIGHSHGGTVARLAMNLWDKSGDYFEPLLDQDVMTELLHEDKCPVCKQARGLRDDLPNQVPRPDGVITFGSPFVRFERRVMGLFSTQVLVWVLRIVGLLATVFTCLFDWITPLGLTDAIHFIWPAAVFWLVTFYLPKHKGGGLHGKSGKEKAKARTASIGRSILYWTGFAAMIGYYIIEMTRFGSSLGMSLRLDTSILQVLVPVVLYWLLLISIPHRFLKKVGREVQALRDRLPSKYDPVENLDNPARYLCYHTPGDEAGMHLRIFGFITWLVQTLMLTAAIFFASTILLGVVVGLFLIFPDLISVIGFSPIDNPDGFAGVLNALSYPPRVLWNMLNSGAPLLQLDPAIVDGALATRLGEHMFEVAAVSVIGLMPVIVGFVAIAYLLSMWLRGSGLVFGSERMTWTLANRITAKRTANHNTRRRLFFIAPEAWWNMEMAHCYFYKCNRVIRDVAEHIAQWDSGIFKPSHNVPIERLLASVISWIIVVFFVLSIFAISVSHVAS